ncbi:hypothetical protein CfE428DRAFT_5094 [Chthoniobacter flavus Ellin428]|uniref:Uncharacterized protein n=1 Tax=Chthoniobacter flavus Ellin428 TaxID=497964 RepID=B4D854_9BACT|nr:hypothetical protein [Chthoniobacter flavus]EDY17408.1 hypothetical protein CfE428DRAFT_5094 [Chthoniobacter flavus Ellin428]TCO87345.1 type II secretion system protein I [Chthoniobacter flavus]
MKHQATRSAGGSHRGFMLLETLLAVAIFAIGVLALGQGVSKGLRVERIMNEEARARRVLQNRFAEIEAGAIPSKDSHEKLGGVATGLTLTQKRTQLHKTDEHGQELANLFSVTLTVDWMSDGDKETRSLTFYVLPQQP